MSGKENPFAKFLSRYKKGDFVFQQDEEGDEMYIVPVGSGSYSEEDRGQTNHRHRSRKG